MITTLIDKFKSLVSAKKSLRLSGQIKKYLKMLEENPEDMRLKIKVGELYLQERHIDLGIQELEEVAKYYFKQDFTLKAIAIYKTILKYAPAKVEYNQRLAELFCKLSLLADAATHYRIVIHYHQTHRQFDLALQAAKELVKSDPDQVQHQLDLAELYLGQGMTLEALTQWESVTQILREQKSKPELLIEVNQKILTKKPENFVVLKEFCKLTLERQQYEKLIKQLERMKLTKSSDFISYYEQAIQAKEAQESQLA